MQLVVLDRDGVINADSPDYVKSVDEWQPLPGSLDAVARLNQAGFRVVVATNQSAVGRGLISVETLSRIHEHMHLQISAHGGAIDAVFYCACAPNAGCECRKPAPGMLLEILDRTNRAAEDVICIGDSLRDVEASRAAGMSAVLVRTGNGARTEAELDPDWNVAVYDDLAAAAAALIAVGPAAGPR